MRDFKLLKMKKILTVLLNVLLVFLLVIGSVIAFSMLPLRGNVKILAVTSGSMEKAIHVGSVVIIRPSSSYQVGDIINFVTPDGKSDKDTTTHRIYQISNEGGSDTYTTKGDANSSPDMRTISGQAIKGRVIFTLPWVGYGLGYIKTLPGLILIIIIPAIAIVTEEILNIRREAKVILAKRRDKKETKKTKRKK